MARRVCLNCNGSGRIHTVTVDGKKSPITYPCGRCGGSGSITVADRCSACGGTGLTSDRKDRCPKCRGSGTI